MANKFVKPAVIGGSADGSSWANAWSDLQTAVDAVSAGDDIFCQGTETLTVQIDIDGAAGTATAPIRIIGVNTDESGDPNDDVDGTLYTIDGDSTAADCLNVASGKDFYKLFNIECINATDDGIDLANNDSCGIWGCRFNNNGSNGLEGYGFGNVVCQTQANNNTTNGMDGVISENGVAILSEFIGNGGDGVNSGNVANAVLLCVAHNNTLAGYDLGSFTHAFLCVSDGNGQRGIDGGSRMSAFFNRLTNNGAYGINTPGSQPGVTGFNAFYNNTSGEAENAANYAGINLTGSDISMSGDGYNNLAGDDFTLTDSAEFRRRALNVGSYSV